MGHDTGNVASSIKILKSKQSHKRVRFEFIKIKFLVRIWFLNV